MLRAQWSSNPNVLPHFTVSSAPSSHSHAVILSIMNMMYPCQIGNMNHSLDIYTGKVRDNFHFTSKTLLTSWRFVVFQGELLARLSDNKRSVI